MNTKMKMGLLVLLAGVAPGLACGGGTSIGMKLGTGGSTGATGTGGDDNPSGVGGATGAGGTTGGIGGATGAGGTTGGIGGATGAGGMVGGTGGALGPIKVLIWNNALTYGHQSRMTAIPLLKAREATDNIMFDTTYAHTASLPEGTVDPNSNPSVFTDAGLDPYDVVFFLNTTGNTMDQDGQATTHRNALINFMRKGRGYVGTHSATDTYQGVNWPWYVDFMGANFANHSPVGTLGTARYFQGLTSHPIFTAAATPNPMSRQEEWYVFTRDPLSATVIPGIQILQTVTDVSITTQRPITWVHVMPAEPGVRSGRMFYTAMGHLVGAFNEKPVMDMIIAGIKWAAYRL